MMIDNVRKIYLQISENENRAVFPIGQVIHSGCFRLLCFNSKNRIAAV